MSETVRDEIESTDTAVEEIEFLTFEQIKNAKDITERVVHISEWNGNVLVKSISKRQIDAIRNQARDQNGEVDEDKVDMFLFCTGLVKPTVTAEQYEEMRDKSFTAWVKILQAIKDTSHVGEGQKAQAEQRFPG